MSPVPLRLHRDKGDIGLFPITPAAGPDPTSLTCLCISMFSPYDIS